MFNRLKNMYLEERIGEKELDNAIAKGWISIKQKLEIMNAKLEQDSELAEEELLKQLS